MPQASFTPLPNQTSFLPPETEDTLHTVTARQKIERPPVEFEDLSEPDPIVVQDLLNKLRSWELSELLEKRKVKEPPTELQAKLLAGRGITAENVEDFLQIDLDKIPRAHDEERPLKNALESQKLVLKSVLLGEKIYKFSDYDVDGLTSGSTFVLAIRSLTKTIKRLKEETSSLEDLLTELGQQLPHAEKAIQAVREEFTRGRIEVSWDRVGDVQLNVEAAKRFEHGFGLNDKAIKEAIQLGSNSIYVGDCGMPTAEQREILAKHNIELIVIDHHLIHGDLPKDALLINPHQPGCNFADGLFSTVGIEASILRDLVDPATEQELLALAGLGGHCDVMPAFGPNRILAYHTLQHFRNSPPPWIQALMDRVGYGTVQLTADTLGFTIGPIINALGRMCDDTSLIVKFITAETYEEAEQHVDQIIGYNTQRKALGQELLSLSLDTFDFDKPGIIGSFHSFEELEDKPVKGVIGIIAGLLMRKFGKMALVYARDVEKVITASGRSLDHIHMTELLHGVHDELKSRSLGGFLSHGGHAAAAGCKNHQDILGDIQKTIYRKLDSIPPPKITVPHHLTLNLEDVTYKTYIEIHQLLVPWGHKLPAPSVRIEGALVEEIVDKNGHNLMIRVRQKEEVRILRWFGESHFLSRIKDHPLREGAFLDIVGTIHLERNNGDLSTRIYIDEVKPATRVGEWYAQETASIRKQSRKMHQNLLPARLEYTPPEKEPSQALGSRRVKKLDGFTQRSTKGKQTPLDKAIAQKAEREREIEEYREAFDVAEKRSQQALETDLVQDEEQVSAASLWSDVHDQEKEEQKEKEETQLSSVNYLFPELQEEHDNQDLAVEDSEVKKTEALWDEEFNREVVVDAEPWKIVPLHDHSSVVIPESVREHYERHPALFVRQDAIGYRAPQMLGLTFIRETQRLIKEEAESGRIAEEHRYLPHFIVESDMNTGKTCLALQAAAPCFEEPGSVIFIAHQGGNATQIKKEALRYLHLKEEDIVIITGDIPVEEREELCQKKSKLYIVTAGAYHNCLKEGFVPEDTIFSAVIWDECQYVKGDTNHVKLHRKLKAKITPETLILFMSGTISEIDDLQERFAPKGLIYEVPSQMKHVELRDEPVVLADNELNHLNTIQRKLLPLVGEISAILTPISVPEDEVLEIRMGLLIEELQRVLDPIFEKHQIEKTTKSLRKQEILEELQDERFQKTLKHKDILEKLRAKKGLGTLVERLIESQDSPRKARALKRIKKEKKLLLDWDERFQKIAKFTKKEGTLRVSSYGDFASYLDDYTSALHAYKKNPRMSRRITERMGEGLKWLLAFNELNLLVNTKATSERFAILNYAMPMYWSLLHKGAGSEHKAQHYEELVYGDSDITRVFREWSAGTHYEWIFDWEYQKISDFVAKKKGLGFASAEETYRSFFELAEQDYTAKLIRGEISNGPKTELVPELLGKHLSTDERAKAYVFVQFTSTARLLERYVNGLDLGFRAISCIGKQGLRAHEARVQDRAFEQFKTGEDGVRVAIGTDVLKVGRHVDDSSLAIYFNLDPREQEFLQSLARLRSENPLAYLLATTYCGPDMAYLGINWGIYKRRKDKFRDVYEEH